MSAFSTPSAENSRPVKSQTHRSQINVKFRVISERLIHVDWCWQKPGFIIRKYITKVKITMKTSLIVIEAETEVKNAEKWCVRYIITLHYKEISTG